jgi:hypothetical protein
MPKENENKIEVVNSRTDLAASPTMQALDFEAITSKKPHKTYLDYCGATLMAIPQALATVVATQPLYNAKTLQQTSSVRGGLTFLSVFQEMHKKGGLFRGSQLSVAKLGISNAIFNPALLFADRALSEEFTKENPFTSAMVKGAFSALSRVALNPLDVALTRKITKGATMETMLVELAQEKDIVAKGKLAFRGSAIEASKSFVGLGIMFFIKDQLQEVKKLLTRSEEDKPLSVVDTAFAGLLAGTIKNIATQPSDTIARVQQSEIKAKTVGDAIDILCKRAKDSESSLLRVLYRGFVPKTFSSAAVTAITLLGLEASKHFSDLVVGKGKECSKER